MQAVPVRFSAEIEKVKPLGKEIWFTYQVGRIVGQVNGVEMYINGVIASYYTGDNSDSHQELRTDIIEVMTLDAKIQAVKKIAIKLGLEYTRQNKSDLYRWKEIRNIVAHGVPLHTSTPGKEGNSPVLIYNDQFYDIDELTEDFFSRQGRLTQYLESVQDRVNTAI